LGPAQGYEIDKVTGEFFWTGERDLTSDEVFNPSLVEHQSKLEQAKQFLLQRAFPDGGLAPPEKY
jgi:hypothetical protein